jgi:hypothetical protein
MDPNSKSPSEADRYKAEADGKFSEAEGSGRDFEPVSIRGESLSETVLRERRQSFSGESTTRGTAYIGYTS